MTPLSPGNGHVQQGACAALLCGVEPGGTQHDCNIPMIRITVIGLLLCRNLTISVMNCKLFTFVTCWVSWFSTLRTVALNAEVRFSTVSFLS